MSDKEVEEKIRDCSDALYYPDCNFTEWDCEFIESIEEQFYEKGFLTGKQKFQLQKVWEKI